MLISTVPKREKCTLTAAELATCQPVAGDGGQVLHAFCPFHGSEHQRSLRVQLHSGRFVCVTCGAWGSLAVAREQRQAVSRRPPARQQRVPRSERASHPARARQPRPHPSAPRAPAPAPPDLPQQLATFQAALPGSRGEAYLQQRGIPLALAQQLGVGYAAPGTWPQTDRDWQWGRVVFPHTTPAGRLVNLYGRAVGTAVQVSKALRHAHLPGAKGYFNAPALQTGAGPVWVCEGAFDALALLAAGVPRVVALFGVQGWHWAWARDVRELVFALDADAAGQQQWQALARQAALRGRRVAALAPAAYGGQKDVNAAWVAGTLAVEVWSVPAVEGSALRTVPEDLHEV